MAKAFENNPIDFGDAKEMMKILKSYGADKGQRREEMKTIGKEVTRLTNMDSGPNPKKKTDEPKIYYSNPVEKEHRERMDLR
jgi:hypothetical protein